MGRHSRSALPGTLRAAGSTPGRTFRAARTYERAAAHMHEYGRPERSPAYRAWRTIFLNSVRPLLSALTGGRALRPNPIVRVGFAPRPDWQRPTTRRRSGSVPWRSVRHDWRLSLLRANRSARSSRSAAAVEVHLK